MKITIPIKTVSELNQREHWAARNRRKKQQQTAVAAYMRQARTMPKPPCVVTLTRFVVRKKRLDQGNCEAAFKHVQDQIAKELGIDDGDTSKVRWQYEQRDNGDNEHGIEIEIITLTPAGAEAA